MIATELGRGLIWAALNHYTWRAEEARLAGDWILYCTALANVAMAFASIIAWGKDYHRTMLTGGAPKKLKGTIKGAGDYDIFLHDKPDQQAADFFERAIAALDSRDKATLPSERDRHFNRAILDLGVARVVAEHIDDDELRETAIRIIDMTRNELI